MYQLEIKNPSSIKKHENSDRLKEFVSGHSNLNINHINLFFFFFITRTGHIWSTLRERWFGFCGEGMTLEKDFTKRRLSVCPVGTGAHRDAGTGSPRAGGPWGQHGEVQGQRFTWNTAHILWGAACPLSPSSPDINSVTEVESHSRTGGPDVSVLYLVARPRYCCFVLKALAPLPQVCPYWCHFPGASAHCVSLRPQFGNCCSISNALQQKDNNSLKAQVMAKIFFSTKVFF